MIHYNEDKSHCVITLEKDSYHVLFNVDAIFFPGSAILIRRHEVDSDGYVDIKRGELRFGNYTLPTKDIHSVEFPMGKHIEKVTINLK